MGFIAKIGRHTLSALADVGHFSIFAYNGVKALFSRTFFWREVLKQFLELGFYSLPIVGLTAVFAGMVLALQTYTGFARFSGESAVATVVLISITRELGPVLSGLMVAGRISSSIAAELGAMRISEQIDALETMNVDPYKYLIIPRILAGVLMLPILVFIADILGVFGGYIVGITKLGFSSAVYLNQTVNNIESIDVICGLVKAVAFGFSIAAFGCYSGFYCKKGAKGVGEATTNAVVFACILILIFNYLLTAMFFGL